MNNLATRLTFGHSFPEMLDLPPNGLQVGEGTLTLGD